MCKINQSNTFSIFSPAGDVTENFHCAESVRAPDYTAERPSGN